jgi:hypothetical protein
LQLANDSEILRGTAAGERVPGQLTGGRTPAAGLWCERRCGERRTPNLGSLFYGGLRPRRRAGRRNGDAQRVFLDWHEPRVLYLGLAILLMSCLDALLTLNILGAGGRELNGMMAWLLNRDTDWFIGVKIGVTGVGVILLTIAVNRHFFGRIPVIHLLWGFCTGYAALMIWELFLLASLFPGLIGGGSVAWAGVLR